MHWRDLGLGCSYFLYGVVYITAKVVSYFTVQILFLKVGLIIYSKEALFILLAVTVNFRLTDSLAKHTQQFNQ
jgi:hypothetical protein